MSFARPLRILLALLLLCAQQLALAHQVWHLGDKSGQPAQKQLCDKHEALGTVAGALHGSAVAQVADAPAGFVVLCACVPAATTTGSIPSSRGPPSLL